MIQSSHGSLEGKASEWWRGSGAIVCRYSGKQCETTLAIMHTGMVSVSTRKPWHPS